MKFMSDLFNFLKNSLTFENPAILTFGAKWFNENIVLPIKDLTTMDIDISKLDETQNTIFFMALQAVGDIAFLLRGYGTANYWYKKFHLFNMYEREILHDIAHTYELIGDFDNARKYYQNYFGDNHAIELFDDGDSELPTKTHIYDHLIKFQPKFVIDNYRNTEQIEIYRLVTMAYFMLGKESKNIVYNRIKNYFKNANIPSIDRVDLFYAIDFFCDQHQFWKIILDYKPNIDIIDHNFDSLYSVSHHSIDKKNDSKVNDTLLLHFTRSCNDLRTMKKFLKNDYLYKAADTCVKFFNGRNRMPNWKEFYLLMTTTRQDISVNKAVNGKKLVIQ
jgi:tetratricopeptide (TPR) repeat protein